ncbi:MAG: WYL domain-containing protein [Spirochaetales bacterium]|nr:WYL domain-containing protein [Spirochaetales bacterium]
MAFSVDNYIIVSRLMSRSNGTTVKEMANALNVSERQVYNILEQMYFILYYEQYKDPENARITRYKALGDSPKLNLPELELSDDEIAVFNQLRENAELSPALRQTAETMFEKLQLMASERGKKIQVGDNSRRLILNAHTTSKSVGTKNTTKAIQTILDIIKKHQWMNLTYRKMDASAPHPYNNLYPLQLFVANGDVYVYVLNHKKELRMLALERIDKITPYDGEIVEQFYDFRALLSDPFGIILEEKEPYTVKLWINNWEGTYLKQKEWPDSVKITDNDDGSIIFEAETRTHYDCVTWIQARIDRIKILEPEWLRQEVMDNLRKAMELNAD